MCTLSLVTAPAAEPITVAEAAEHCRVSQGLEDSYLGGLISTAREIVERETRRALITQTWDAKWDQIPACWPLELPKAPLISVTSLKYLDTDGTQQTWASTNYRVLANAGPTAMPGRVAVAYGISLPSVRSIEESFIVRFVAGYGAAGSSVPAPIRHAILLAVGDLYARRENVITGTISTPVSLGISRLLASYVVPGY